MCVINLIRARCQHVNNVAEKSLFHSDAAFAGEHFALNM